MSLLVTGSIGIDTVTTPYGRAENVLGGSPRTDVICGLDGKDRIRPGGGRDRVYAGPDADVVSVRDGRRDVVSCGSGLDSITADAIDRVASDCERVERR